MYNFLRLDGLNIHLRMELASFLYAGGPLRNLTNLLQGDGELSFVAFTVIDQTVFPLRTHTLNDTGRRPLDIPRIGDLAPAAIEWAESTDLAESRMRAEAAAARARDAAAAGAPPAASRTTTRRLTGEAAAAQARVAEQDAQRLAETQLELDRQKDAAEAALVAAIHASPPTTVEGWQDRARRQIEPACGYFFRRLDEEHGDEMAIFKAASVFHPGTLSKLDLPEARVRLRGLPRHKSFNPARVDALLGNLELVAKEAAEWAAARVGIEPGDEVEVQLSAREQLMTKGKVKEYVAGTLAASAYYVVSVKTATGKTEDHSVPPDRVHPKLLSVLSYFMHRKHKFPEWFTAAKTLALLQPTSATAERTFSLLEAMFGKRGHRGQSRADLIDTGLKLRLHDRPV